MDAPSLSGQKVTVETTIFCLPANIIRGMRRVGWEPDTEEIVVPEGNRMGGATPEAYNEYRKGLDSACADVVITTLLDNGTPAVVASQRTGAKLFSNKWWMQGGAIHAYRRISDFVAERAAKECGVRPQIQALMGVFRTCGPDAHGSTTNLCFVGYALREGLVNAKHDPDHKGQRLFTLSDLDGIPEEERHWYPMRAFHMALKTMP